MTRTLVKLAVTVVALTFGTGCAHFTRSRLPPTEVDWPMLDLTLSWNGYHYTVPAPAVIPTNRLEQGFREWDRHRSAHWPIKLPDGRTAVVQATRDQSGAVSLDHTYVYRMDGSLGLEQWNINGRPNIPGYWIVYAADGRTREVEVFAAHGYVNEVVFYQSGVRARRYEVSDRAIVQVEDRISPDGTTTAVNLRRDLR